MSIAYGDAPELFAQLDEVVGIAATRWTRPGAKSKLASFMVLWGVWSRWGRLPRAIAELGVRHKRRVIRTIPRREVDLLSKGGILVKFNSFRQVAFQRLLNGQDGVDNVRYDSLGLPNEGDS